VAAEATQAAQDFAGAAHAVWGQPTANADVIVSPLPFNCPDGLPACIRVDVFRGMPDRANTAHTNVLPTYILPLVNRDTQGVRATATAQVAAGNNVRCIKPWIVADKWTDGSNTGINTSGWDQMDTFNPAQDTYAPHGFSAETDVGYELMLKGAGNDWSAGWSLEIDLGGGNGSSVYGQEIVGCPSWVPSVGLYDGQACNEKNTDLNYEKGCLNVKTGVSQGPTRDNTNDLIALDMGASWSTALNKVVGGCQVTFTCSNPNDPLLPPGQSPRVVPLALFDPAAYWTNCQTNNCNGNNGMARVVNLLGFFIEGMCSDVYPNQATRPPWCGTNSDAQKMVVGRLMKYPGQGVGGSGSAGPWSFIKIVRLIR